MMHLSDIASKVSGEASYDATGLAHDANETLHNSNNREMACQLVTGGGACQIRAFRF